MKAYAMIAVLLALLGAALWAGFRMWTMMPGGGMSGNEYSAIILGIFFSLLVGCGLMALLFYSSRRGYDDAADPDVQERGRRAALRLSRERPAARTPRSRNSL